MGGSHESVIDSAREIAEVSLDPSDWDGMRSLGRRMVDDMITHLETLRERPVWKPVPQRIRERLEAPLPLEGSSPEHVYEDFRDLVLPYSLGNIHPRFWAWVNGTGTVFTVLAELLAATMNSNCYGCDMSPFYVEQQVIGWLKELLGYPGEASGLLVSGASIANFVGLSVALQAKAQTDVGRLGIRALPKPMTLYTSEESHHSIEKAVRMLGLGTEALRTIPVDSEFRLVLQELRTAIEADRKEGFHPFCVVGTAGTVRTGATDPLMELADLCKSEDLWFHVDGAFGAFAKAAPSLADSVSGLERADSLGFDLHKWMFMPIETGCVLVRDSEAHREAFRASAGYLQRTSEGIAAIDDPFGDYGPQLTRGFRALKVWMGLREQGAKRYVRVIEQNVAQARYLRDLVESAPDLELLAPVPLNVVCFRYTGRSIETPDLDPLNHRIVLELQKSGLAALSPISVNERGGLRAAITNHRTRMDDIDAMVKGVRTMGAQLFNGSSRVGRTP